MSLYYENLQPQAEANYAVNGVAFATNKAATFGSTVAITGNTTVAGSLAVTGTITGPRTTSFTTSALVGATVALTAAQSGGTFQNVSTSGSPSWTLPAASKGLEFTFLTGNTTAGYTITCADSAVIHAKTSATGTAISTTTTLTNTQGTAVVGDAIALVCDGTNWWIKSQTGIFAAS
jgi:hypothetical protein